MTGASAACRIVPKNGEGTAGISTCANLDIVRHTRKKWNEKMKWPPYVVAAVTYDRAPAPSCRASGKGLFMHH